MEGVTVNISQNGSMKALDDGEVKTRSKTSIRTNLHYQYQGSNNQRAARWRTCALDKFAKM